MSVNLSSLGTDPVFDIVVIGAGNAGMSAALCAAIDGAKVLLVERTKYVGGSSAYSAGTTWVPNSKHAAKVNPSDNLEQAQRFLDLAIGDHAPKKLREKFLREGANAINFLEQNSEVKYKPRPYHPDYISELDGSTLCGRSLEPIPFDGRRLGEDFYLVRPPIPEFTVLGGMMVDRDDINNLLNMKKSLKALAYSIGIIGRHLKDRLSYSRGTRLVMGNALVARYLYSLNEKGVTILKLTELLNINKDEDGVKSITLQQADTEVTVTVAKGLVLASGGFNRNPERRKKLLPGVDIQWCPGAPGHTGKAQEQALKVGARFGKGAFSNAFWAPVSIRKRKDGSTAVFPHFLMDRGKPGMVTVNQKGERYLNETTSYHLFGIAMQKANQTKPSIPSYIVCDSAALERYGIGMVRPGGHGLRSFLKDGYLIKANTIEQLADKLNVDSANLIHSIKTNNKYAKTGIDLDFHRGETAYQKGNGDPKWQGRNPTLGAIETAPYYAVRVYPGDIGAATGLVTDEFARVLDGDNKPIEGLYACGNDMQSVMGGVYPGPGITLGPGMTFGYIAGRHAVAR